MARLRLGIKAVFGMSNLFDLIIRSCQVQSIFVKVGEMQDLLYIWITQTYIHTSDPPLLA